ncbi:MAG: DNA-directed RNA polymerase subunit alpha C-terminal domain-containing protein, partial [Candidatus Aenigmatarchaeota archaeon]
ILNSKSLGEYIRETKENVMKLMKQDFAAMEEVCNGVRDYLSIINFTEKEKCIIELRFGFIDNKIYTLQEVGDIKKVSRERAREIEAKALRKLRFKIMSEGIPETYHSIQRIKENRIYDSADDVTDIILRELEKLDAVRMNYLSRIHEQTHDIVARDFRIGYSKSNDPQNLPIEELGLSVRVLHALKRRGIRTVNDVTVYTADELKGFRDFGEKRLEELKEKLYVYNLKLK